MLRKKSGKIVDQEDFYVDTSTIDALDRKLSELGVAPVPKAA